MTKRILTTTLVLSSLSAGCLLGAGSFLGCGRPESRRHGLTDAQWVSLLSAEEEPIVWAALQVMQEIPAAPADTALTALLERGSPRVVADAADLLVRRGTLSATALIEAARRAPTAEEKQLLMSRVGALADGTAALLELFRGTETDRALAMEGLAAAPSHAIMPALVEASRSPEAAVRRDVYLVLVRCGPGGDVPPDLVLAGLSDPDPQVRFNAAWAAGACRVRTPEVLGALRRLTSDEAVVPGALRAFLLLGPPAGEAAPEIRRLLSHPNALIRRQAIEALMSVAAASPDTRRALQGLATDRDPLVRETARRALERSQRIRVID